MKKASDTADDVDVASPIREAGSAAEKSEDYVRKLGNIIIKRKKTSK